MTLEEIEKLGIKDYTKRWLKINFDRLEGFEVIGSIFEQEEFLKKVSEQFLEGEFEFTDSRYSMPNIKDSIRKNGGSTLIFNNIKYNGEVYIFSGYAEKGRKSEFLYKIAHFKDRKINGAGVIDRPVYYVNFEDNFILVHNEWGDICGGGLANQLIRDVLLDTTIA